MTFCPLLIKFTFATTDVYVAFFLLTILYLSLLYLEAPSRKRLAEICVLTGIAITIKYNCAIVCLWIAAIVCIDQIKKKRYLEIIKLGAFSVLIVFLTCFFVAPNLFINFQATRDALKVAVRTEHLSADHLGWGGNLLFYLYGFVQNIGCEGILFLAAGCCACVKRKKLGVVFVALNTAFWVLISAAPLHWVRWGTPVYTFFVLLLAVGIGFLVDVVNKRWAKAAVLCLGGILGLNTVLQGLLVVQSATTTEACVAAIDFCNENGITTDNAVYDGYTPFALNGGGPLLSAVSFDKSGNLTTPPGAEYIVLSIMNYDRYCAEPDRAPQIIRIYDDIMNENELIYDAGGQFFECRNIEQFRLDKYRRSGLAVLEIPEAIREFMAHDRDSVGGMEIKIYHLVGEPLEMGKFSWAYTGAEEPVLTEAAHTLSVTITGEDPNVRYLNSNDYRLSYHLYDENGNQLEVACQQTAFGSFVGQLDLAVSVDVGVIPESGTYLLEIDAVQEGETRLPSQNTPTQRIKITVQKDAAQS